MISRQYRAGQIKLGLGAFSLDEPSGSAGRVFDDRAVCLILDGSDQSLGGT